MARYLMTHSLLSSWLYTMKENPFEDATTYRDPMAEFLQVLRREPTPTTEAMMNGNIFEDNCSPMSFEDWNGNVVTFQNGNIFEDLVTRGVNGCADPGEQWYGAAEKVARRVRGGVPQLRASRAIEVDGMTLVLYGRLDWLKAGEIVDIKFTKNYDPGKYFDSTQHPTYFEIVPEAQTFTYMVSNGSAVWPETYRREEASSIRPVISDFFSWLTAVGLMGTYKEKWVAK